MDVDEADDDDEYEVVGYGGAPRAAVTPTRRASDANAARVPSTSARKAPVGFNWDDDLEDEDDRNSKPTRHNEPVVLRRRRGASLS